MERSVAEEACVILEKRYKDCPFTAEEDIVAENFNIALRGEFILFGYVDNTCAKSVANQLSLVYEEGEREKKFQAVGDFMEKLFELDPTTYFRADDWDKDEMGLLVEGAKKDFYFRIDTRKPGEVEQFLAGTAVAARETKRAKES